MWGYYKITTQEAKKDYPCEACEWVVPYINECNFSEEDLFTINKAIFNDCKIKKGTIYRKITGIWEGEWATFRSIPEIDDIALEYELYPEA